MKKYEYVSLEISKFIGSGNEKHREIIDKYACEGYRYAGYIPTKILYNGKIDVVDLIFEKEIDVAE